MPRPLPPLTELVQRVEHTRRAAEVNGDYEPMEKCVADFQVNIRGNGSPLAFKLRANVAYNQSLAWWDQGKASRSPAKERALSFRGLTYALESADHALEADDVVGILYAHMIIGGHFYPDLGRADESFPLLEKTVEEADLLAVKAPPNERRRVVNVAMNCYAHLLRLSIDHGRPTAKVTSLLSSFTVNAVTLGLENEEWAKKLIHKAEEYLERH